MASIVIGGIVVGVIGIFQTRASTAYKYGFVTLFLSTPGFIVWSHVKPRATSEDA